MKLNTQSAPVEIQGQLEQGSFGIKQSPKAFQILSSGLYSNKPMAIVRELSANAADAHVLNGNQKKPFEIKLPNRLDNQFYIKDFGPGLSHEQGFPMAEPALRDEVLAQLKAQVEAEAKENN